MRRRRLRSRGLLLLAVVAGLASLAGGARPAAGQAEGGAPAAKDLRTKEQRLYEIQLRQAQLTLDRRQLEMRTLRADYEAIQALYDERIETVERLNRARRDLLTAERLYNEARFELDRTRLDFLRDATHVAVREARKYRTLDGRRQVDVVLENASQLARALSLNPGRSAEDIRPLLEVQGMTVSLQRADGTIVAEPYEVTVPSMPLGASRRLTFRLLEDVTDVVVSLGFLDQTAEDLHLVLRRESTQDLPTINSVQFSQEGDLNSRVNYDLILERLAEDEKTFRLAVVNLPREITPAFLAPGSGARLRQVKFSDESTRQQLELELQIPEKLSRRYVDDTLEFYVFVADEAGHGRIEQVLARYGDGPVPADTVAALPGNRERFELIPRGRAALETIIANRYQEVRTGEQVHVRVDLVNTGTLDVEGPRVVLGVPEGWEWRAEPDSFARLPPGITEPVALTLVPPQDLGVSEFDVRVEAVGRRGAERVEAQEKDITVRIEARADVVRNVLIIGGVILLVVGVAVGSIKVSRR